MRPADLNDMFHAAAQNMTRDLLPYANGAHGCHVTSIPVRTRPHHIALRVGRILDTISRLRYGDGSVGRHRTETPTLWELLSRLQDEQYTMYRCNEGHPCVVVRNQDGHRPAPQPICGVLHDEVREIASWLASTPPDPQTGIALQMWIDVERLDLLLSEYTRTKEDAADNLSAFCSTAKLLTGFATPIDKGCLPGADLASKNSPGP